MKLLKYIIVIIPLCIFCQSWTVQVIAEIDGWNAGIIATDTFNKLGVSPDAVDGQDEMGVDVPDPGCDPPGNCINLYFPHPEWDDPIFTIFAQDIRYENDSLLNETGITWNAEIYSNMFGETTIIFDVEGDFPDCQITVIIDDSNYTISDGDTVFTNLVEYEYKSLEINVGNCDYPLSISIPQPVSPLLVNTYPNPFNNTVNIDYYLTEPGIVTIQMYDGLGHIITDAIDRRIFQQAGQHIFNLQSDNIVSGIYFITIESGEYQTTKQVTLLK